MNVIPPQNKEWLFIAVPPTAEHGVGHLIVQHPLLPSPQCYGLNPSPIFFIPFVFRSIALAQVPPMVPKGQDECLRRKITVREDLYVCATNWLESKQACHSFITLGH